MNRPALCRLVPLLVLALLSPLAADAHSPARQEGTTATSQEATTAPAAPGQEVAAAEIQPIDEGEIPTRAELVAADLRRIETLIQLAPEIERIDSALDAREIEIVRQRAALDAVDPNHVSLRRLGDLRLPWLQLDAELTAWAIVVSHRFGTLQDERERLREARALWELTAREVEAENLAPELQERVDAMLIDVLDVEARVREQRNDVGALAGRITSRQEFVFDSLARIDEIVTIARDGLFTRDAPALWHSFGATEAGPFAGEALDSGRNWARALLGYVRLRAGRTVLLVAWFFVLLLGILRLRRQAGGWPADNDGAERFRRLIARPFSMAMAFAMVAALLILPYPVGSASDVLMLIAFVAILRLGSVVLSPNARRGLYGIAALMLLVRVAAAGPDASLATRLLLLVVMALGFLGTGLAGMRGRKGAKERGGWARAVNAGVSAAAIMLGFALFANLLGWVQLSKMLTEATIGSLFAAFGWAIVVAAVAALLPPVIGGPLGDRLPSLRRNQAAVLRFSIGKVGIVASIIWLHSTLVRFQLWETVRAYGASIASSALSIGGLTISTGGILAAILILFMTWVIARAVGFVLREEVMPRLRLRRGAGQSLITLVNYTVYAIGIMLTASAMGLTGTQLAVVVGALSVGIGFGLQTIVNNFVSGLILIFERPIQAGDTIETATHFGRVQRIGIRASTIYTFDGAEIIVPNGELIAKEVINWTRTDEIRRAEVVVGVAYGTDPEAVLEILLRVAEEHSMVRKHPEPKAQMIRFGDSSLDFHLRCWTRVDDRLDLVSDLHVAINRELKAAGITIPFPQRDLHVIPKPGEGAPDLTLPLEPPTQPD